MTNIINYQDQQNQLDIFTNMAKIALSSGKYPKEYDLSTIMNVFLTAKDLGISPMKALNGGFYIVNGKISMSTTLMVDRIRSAGHSIKIVEWNKDKCVIIGRRKDNDDSVKLEYTWDDAQLAGLTMSPTWKKYPKVMLYNRAMSMISRVLFPDVVGNSYSEDEKYEIQGIPAEKRPVDEDLSADIVVNTVTGEVEALSDKLTEHQCAELDEYFKDDPEAVEKIEGLLKLESVYSMSQEDFPKIIKTLKRRKNDKQNESNKVA